MARARTPGPPLCHFSGGKWNCIGPAQHFDCRYGLAIARGPDGLVWLADAGKVCSWDGRTGRVFSLVDASSKVQTQGPYAVGVARDNSVWVGLFHGKVKSGLVQLDHGVWKTPIVPGIDPALLDVSTLRVDRLDGLWIGTLTQGVFHLHAGLLEHFDKSTGLTGDEITDIHEDREGSVWVSTTSGIDRFNRLKISTLTRREGLSADEVSGISVGRNQTLWVGNRNSLDVITDALASASITKIPVPGHKVTTVLETSSGERYLGADDDLLQLVNGRFHIIKTEDGGSLGTIRALTEDPGGRIWVLGASGVLYRLTLDHKAEQMSQPKDGKAILLAADSTDGVWIWKAGFRLIHYANGVPTVPFPEIPKDLLFSINSRHDRSVWLNGRDGVHIFAGGRQFKISADNGLPCTQVYSSIQDNDGASWLYTSCGLIRISQSEVIDSMTNPKRMVHFDLFDSADGAQPGPPNFGPEVGKTHSGRLWFENQWSLQTLDPANLQINKIAPPMQIESIIADHKSFALDNVVRLPPNTRDVEIDYAGLSLASPRKMNFRYKLSGVDRDWNDMTTRREAFFMNLPPGSYVFQVIGSNNDGVWNMTGATLRFVIPPTLTQKVWFKILCALLAIAMILVAILYRLRALTREIRSNLSERLYERERIARELHDTLLQGFQGLLLRFETATRRIPDGLPAREMMESALDRADEVLIEGRNRVRALRSEGMIVQDLQEAFGSLGRSMKTDVSAEFSVNLMGTARSLHPVVKDEMFWIGREAILNAFAHAHASNIITTISFERNQLILVWSDDGRSIDRALLEVGRDGHWGLRGMRERAEEIGGTFEIVSRPGNGTKVELRVPASIAYETSATRSWAERLKTCLLG